MIEKDFGFVLRRYNFRETSLITTLYTKRFGKIRGILKGFYSQKREFSSPLETFSLNEFVFYPKKSEIWLISHVDLADGFSFLRSDLRKAKIAGIFLNIIDRTMQLWDRNEKVFNLMSNCLSCLENERAEKVLYIFLIKFLTLSGFKPEFDHCITCKNFLGEDLFFSVAKGGLICKDCYRKVYDAKKISRQASRSLIYIEKEDFPLALRLNLDYRCEEEIFYILDEFLSYHLDFNDLERLATKRMAYAKDSLSGNNYKKY